MRKSEFIARIDLVGPIRSIGSGDAAEEDEMSNDPREDFVMIWQTSNSLAEVAQRFGRSTEYCTNRATQLRSAGIELKRFSLAPLGKDGKAKLRDLANSFVNEQPDGGDGNAEPHGGENEEPIEHRIAARALYRLFVWLEASEEVLGCEELRDELIEATCTELDESRAPDLRECFELVLSAVDAEIRTWRASAGPIVACAEEP